MRDSALPWIAVLPLTILFVATKAPHDGKDYFYAIVAVSVALIGAAWGVLEIVKQAFRAIVAVRREKQE